MEKEHFYGEHGGLGAGGLILWNLLRKSVNYKRINLRYL